MEEAIHSMIKDIKRFFLRKNWYNLRTLVPISRIFGLDRGTPIDRYYIDQFFKVNQADIKGLVLEISEDTYSRKFGNDIEKIEVLHFDSSNPQATIIGDLTKRETLPCEKFDCFVCPQTLNVIYDFKEAIRGGHYLLKSNGVMLTTVAGLCQVSKYDMERWGDYWRFTDLSISKAFKEIFGDNNVEVVAYGNVLSAISLLEGISVEELSQKELDFKDNVYQVLIAIKAWKR